MLKKLLFVLFFLLTSALQSQDMAFQTPVNISAATPFGGSCSSQVIAYDVGNTGNTVCAYLTNNGSDYLVSILVSTDDGATWNTPQILSVTGQNASNPLLAFSSNGVGICVWMQYFGYNRVIQAARTTNGGITWSTPQIIETTTGYFLASLAIDNSGRAICYVSGPSAKAISTSDGGISWSTPVTLLAGNASSESGVAMDNSGHGVCVFTSSNLVMATGTSDGGLSWSTPVQVSTSGTTPRSPRIAYDQVNNAFCTVWYIYEGQSVQASKTSDVGNSWSTPVNLSVASSVYDPKIAFYNGSGICVWGENGFVQSSKTTDGGASWATKISITGGGPSDIQFDSNGVGLCLITSLGKVQVCRTLDQGTSWQTPIDISPTGSSSPVIALNAPNAVCIWAQSQGSNYILKSSRSVDDGLTWQTALSLTVLNENANNPQISFDASGNGICVWTRFDGTNTLIQASRTTNKGATWSTPQNISLPGTDTQKPAIKCGTNGNAICTWLAGSSAPYSVKASKTNDGGITWSTPVTFSTNGVWPQVGFDSNHNMFCLIWGNGVSSIIGVSTTDNGTSWTTPVTIGSAYSARIDFDHFGNGICAMVDSSYNIKASKTINGGLSWSAATTFSSGGYVSYTDDPLSLDFGGSNQAVLLWERQSGDYVIQESATTDGGLNWQVPIVLSTVESSYHPTVAFENGIAISLWKAGSNGNIAISRSIDGGITWQTPYNIASTGADFPQVDMIGSEAVAVWLKSDGLNNLVQAVFSSDAGASWTTPVNISATGQDALIPQIAMYSNVAENAGMAALSVWTRSNGSNNIIQSASTEALSPSPYSFSVVGKQSIINGMFQKDVVNQISWDSVPSAATYRVYNDSNVLLYQGSGPYYEHGMKVGKHYGYIVAWVDASGNENDPVVISLP